MVAGDDAGFFERAQATKTGRRRKADTVGEILVTDAAILLEVAKYLAVEAVDVHKFLTISEKWNFLSFIFN